MFQRILVGYDGSDIARQALRESIQFAKDQQAQVRIVSVIDLTPLYWQVLPGLDLSQIEWSLNRQWAIVSFVAFVLRRQVRSPPCSTSPLWTVCGLVTVGVSFAVAYRFGAYRCWALARQGILRSRLALILPKRFGALSYDKRSDLLNRSRQRELYAEVTHTHPESEQVGPIATSGAGG
jgi:universal stress protein family protein